MFHSLSKTYKFSEFCKFSKTFRKICQRLLLQLRLIIREHYLKSSGVWREWPLTDRILDARYVCYPGAATRGALAFLRILQNSLETPVLDSPFYKILGLRLASLLKKRLWYRCFPVNFAIFQELLFHRTPSGDRFWWLCDSISCKKYQSPVYSWRKDKEKNKSFQNFS